jgi:hypothetical protein
MLCSVVHLITDAQKTPFTALKSRKNDDDNQPMNGRNDSEEKNKIMREKNGLCGIHRGNKRNQIYFGSFFFEKDKNGDDLTG